MSADRIKRAELTGWICPYCGPGVEATYEEHCAECGSALWAEHYQSLPWFAKEIQGLAADLKQALEDKKWAEIERKSASKLVDIHISTIKELQGENNQRGIALERLRENHAALQLERDSLRAQLVECQQKANKALELRGAALDAMDMRAELAVAEEKLRLSELAIVAKNAEIAYLTQTRRECSEKLAAYERPLEGLEEIEARHRLGESEPEDPNDSGTDAHLDAWSSGHNDRGILLNALRHERGLREQAGGQTVRDLAVIKALRTRNQELTRKFGELYADLHAEVNDRADAEHEARSKCALAQSYLRRADQAEREVQKWKVGAFPETARHLLALIAAVQAAVKKEIEAPEGERSQRHSELLQALGPLLMVETGGRS